MILVPTKEPEISITRLTPTGERRRGHADAVQMSLGKTLMKMAEGTNDRPGSLTRVEPSQHLQTPRHILAHFESIARPCFMSEITPNVQIVLGLV